MGENPGGNSARSDQGTPVKMIPPTMRWNLGRGCTLPKNSVVDGAPRRTENSGGNGSSSLVDMMECSDGCPKSQWAPHGGRSSPNRCTT